MIVWAASGQLVADNAATASGSFAVILPTGSGSMMTPVENGSTSWSAQPSSAATLAHVTRASRNPGSPVPAFALPVLTTRPRIAGLRDK